MGSIKVSPPHKQLKYVQGLVFALSSYTISFLGLSLMSKNSGSSQQYKSLCICIRQLPKRADALYVNGGFLTPCWCKGINFLNYMQASISIFFCVPMQFFFKSPAEHAARPIFSWKIFCISPYYFLLPISSTQNHSKGTSYRISIYIYR